MPLFSSTEMAVFTNRQNLSATGTIKREKNVIFMTNLGIFHIIAISSFFYPFYFLSYFSTRNYFYTEFLIITVKKSKDPCDHENVNFLFCFRHLRLIEVPLYYFILIWILILLWMHWICQWKHNSTPYFGALNFEVIY